MGDIWWFVRTIWLSSVPLPKGRPLDALFEQVLLCIAHDKTPTEQFYFQSLLRNEWSIYSDPPSLHIFVNVLPYGAQHIWEPFVRAAILVSHGKLICVTGRRAMPMLILVNMFLLYNCYGSMYWCGLFSRNGQLNGIKNCYSYQNWKFSIATLEKGLLW